jgi:hypothetical protein
VDCDSEKGVRVAHRTGGKGAGASGRPHRVWPPSDVRKAEWSIVNKVKVAEDEKFIYLESAIAMKVKSRGLTKRGMIWIPVFQEPVFQIKVILMFHLMNKDLRSCDLKSLF